MRVRINKKLKAYRLCEPTIIVEPGIYEAYIKQDGSAEISCQGNWMLVQEGYWEPVDEEGVERAANDLCDLLEYEWGLGDGPPGESCKAYLAACKTLARKPKFDCFVDV